MYYLKKSARKTGKNNLIKKLDKVFSRYIRLRDSQPFGYKYFRCISCGEIKPFEKGDCGHFYSRRHMATRYSEVNCHCECSYCNRFRADHLIGYQKNLIEKIGQARFDLLAFEASQTKKWTDFELNALINHYNSLIKDMIKV